METTMAEFDRRPAFFGVRAIFFNQKIIICLSCRRINLCLLRRSKDGFVVVDQKGGGDNRGALEAAGIRWVSLYSREGGGMGKCTTHSGGTRAAPVCALNVLKDGHRLLSRAVAGDQTVRIEMAQGGHRSVKPPASGVEEVKAANHRPDEDPAVEPLI
jgi:hypothetical protein